MFLCKLLKNQRVFNKKCQYMCCETVILIMFSYGFSRSFTDGHPEPPPISKGPPSPIWKWNLNIATAAEGHPSLADAERKNMAVEPKKMIPAGDPNQHCKEHDEEIPGYLVRLCKFPLAKSSVEAAVQDPFVRLFAQGVYLRSPCEISQESSKQVRSLFKLISEQDFRSLHKVSIQDLYQRSLSQDLCKRSLNKISVQAICGRSPYEIYLQDLCERRLGKISVQDLYKMSLGKISRKGLLARSLYKFPIRGLLWIIRAQALYKGPPTPCQNLCARSVDCKNAHGAPGIWHAQSAARVAGVISNSHRATTRAIRRAQSCEHMLYFHTTLPTPRNMNIENVVNNVLSRFHALFFRGLQQRTAPPAKNLPEASEVLHLTWNNHHVQNRKCRQFRKTKLSTLSKRRPRSPPKAPLIWPTPANVLACRKCHACHADEKVPDVSHLSRKTMFLTSKCPGCPSPATRNGHSSKDEHGALVKLHLRKRAKRAAHLVRACTVEMHMDTSQGNFYARIYSKKKTEATWTQPSTSTNIYRKNPSVWTHCLGK